MRVKHKVTGEECNVLGAYRSLYLISPFEGGRNIKIKQSSINLLKLNIKPVIEGDSVAIVSISDYDTIDTITVKYPRKKLSI